MGNRFYRSVEVQLTPAGKGWHTDHDHDTGVVRGVLCNNCNVGLGAFKDNPELLIEAANYLKR